MRDEHLERRGARRAASEENSLDGVDQRNDATIDRLHAHAQRLGGLTTRVREPENDLRLDERSGQRGCLTGKRGVHVVVEHIGQRIAVMYLGRIVELADRDTLFATPQHPYSEALIAAAPLPAPATTGSDVVPTDAGIVDAALGSAEAGSGSTQLPLVVPKVDPTGPCS